MKVEAGILGRDRELETIDGLVARAAEGGGALLIYGDAGIGKSALLGRALDRGQAAGLRILRAVGVRTEAHLPFAGLHQLLRPILGGLADLPAPQRTAVAAAFGLATGNADDPFLVAMATLTLLTDAASTAPILVIVDDAQWLDRPTQDALAFVARRLGSDPIVMLIAVRSDEARWIEDAGIEELMLVPLDDIDARGVLEARVPDLPSAVRDRVVREADGNPLALIELSSAAPSDAAVPDAMSSVLPVSDRLERAFAAQCRELPEDTRWLLVIAAIDDRDVLEEMLAAAGVPRAAVEAAVTARLVQVDGSTIRFRHPLIRSTIHQRASPDEQRRAHAALAGVVGDADRVAWHRAAATDVPDETVASLLDQTAERAMRRGARMVAVEALERAAALSEDGHARGLRLLRAVHAANDVGRMDVIARALAESPPLETPDLEDRRQAWIIALSLSGPRSPRELEDLRAVVAAASRAGDDGERDLGLALLQFASARSWWVDPGVEVRSEIASAACQLAPDPRDARGLLIRAIAPEHHIDTVKAQVVERAASTEPVGGIDGRRFATAALWVGALPVAVDLYGVAITGLRREGRLGLLARALIVRALASNYLGTLASVPSDLDEGHRLGIETRQRFYLATANGAQAMYMASRGDVEGAEASIREVERIIVGTQSNATLAVIRHARGMVHLTAGRHQEAYEELRPLFEDEDPSHHRTISGWAISDFADSAALTDHGPEASALLSSFSGDPIRMKMPWLAIGIAYARAVIAAHGDEPDETEAAFAEARAQDLERWPLARARLALAHGTWLRRQRRIARSRTELRAARDVFDVIGVRYLADRAHQELGAGGEYGRHQGAETLDQLTPQELQIVRLAAEGLSNREIGARLYLSHRTVGSHLYRAFPKLGISSRAQLHHALD
jgi:DNA-binding CsgD family transcriptional regulator